MLMSVYNDYILIGKYKSTIIPVSVSKGTEIVYLLL
jgi:hypothetical protein